MKALRSPKAKVERKTLPVRALPASPALRAASASRRGGVEPECPTAFAKRSATRLTRPATTPLADRLLRELPWGSSPVRTDLRRRRVSHAASGSTSASVPPRSTANLLQHFTGSKSPLGTPEGRPARSRSPEYCFTDGNGEFFHAAVEGSYDRFATRGSRPISGNRGGSMAPVRGPGPSSSARRPPWRPAQQRRSDVVTTRDMRGWPNRSAKVPRHLRTTQAPPRVQASSVRREIARPAKRSPADDPLRVGSHPKDGTVACTKNPAARNG